MDAERGKHLHRGFCARSACFDQRHPPRRQQPHSARGRRRRVQRSGNSSGLGGLGRDRSLFTLPGSRHVLLDVGCVGLCARAVRQHRVHRARLSRCDLRNAHRPHGARGRGDCGFCAGPGRGVCRYRSARLGRVRHRRAQRPCVQREHESAVRCLWRRADREDGHDRRGRDVFGGWARGGDLFRAHGRGLSSAGPWPSRLPYRAIQQRPLPDGRASDGLSNRLRHSHRRRRGGHDCRNRLLTGSGRHHLGHSSGRRYSRRPSPTQESWPSSAMCKSRVWAPMRAADTRLSDWRQARIGCARRPRASATTGW